MEETALNLVCYILVNQKRSNRNENIIPTGFNRLGGIVSLSKGYLAVIAAQKQNGKRSISIRQLMSTQNSGILKLFRNTARKPLPYF